MQSSLLHTDSHPSTNIDTKATCRALFYTQTPILQQTLIPKLRAELFSKQTPIPQQTFIHKLRAELSSAHSQWCQQTLMHKVRAELSSTQSQWCQQTLIHKVRAELSSTQSQWWDWNWVPLVSKLHTFTINYTPNSFETSPHLSPLIFFTLITRYFVGK